MKQGILWLLLLCCCTVLTTGCPKKFDEEGRKNVSGTVSYDGNSLKRGTVQFTPIDTKAPAGASAIGGSVNIKDGKYELKKDLGLFVGTYQVRIYSPFIFDPKTGLEATDEDIQARPEEVQGREIIPDKYNAKTTLEITVGEDKNQTHNFELTK